MTNDSFALLRRSSRLLPGVLLLLAGLSSGCGVVFQAGDRIDLDGDGFFAMADPASYNAGVDINDEEARSALRQQLLDLQLDCDDSNDDRNPRASELCDGLDNDCDGFRDDVERDLDGDGFTACGVDPDSTDLKGADCNDARPPEVVDPASAESLLAFVAPFQNPAREEYCGFPTPSDEQVSGWTRTGVLDFGDGSVRPTLGIDDNCDGELLSGEVDADGDGHYRGCEGVLLTDATTAPDLEDTVAVDCIDTQSTIYPTVPDAEARCTELIGPDNRRVDTQCDPELTPNSPDDDEFADDGEDWYADADGDGDGDPSDILNLCFDPLGETDLSGRILGSSAAGIDDCNDQNAAENSFDADGDTFTSCGADGIPNNGDEDFNNGQSFDNDDTIYPGAPELCDRADNDLDNSIDEDFDADLDGSFDESVPACATEYGLAADCDDSNPTLNGNDGDNDGSSSCAGDCDDGNPGISETDADNDGYTTCAVPPDCNDSDASLNLDDIDGDGVTPCDGDCDDNNAQVGPQIQNQCDGVDDTNCDGVLDPLEVDDDGDGVTECEGDCNDADDTLEDLDVDADGVSTCAGDCDDADAAQYPGAPSLCDGEPDNDCNNVDDLNEADADNDGYTICPDGAGLVDCNDNDSSLTPFDSDGDGESTCSGDCNDNNAGLSPTVDADGDGWPTCDIGNQLADCDDNDATMNNSDADGDGNSTCGPDGVAGSADDDCDDNDPTVERNDLDNDNFGTCDTDCDDNDSSVNPNGSEGTTADGVDDDCDGTADEGLLAVGNLAIVEMMVGGIAALGDSAAEYIELVNTGTGSSMIDLRGLTIEVVNVIPDAANPGDTTTVTQTYTLPSDPMGVPLQVVTSDRVVLGRSSAIDGLNLEVANPSATYSVSGTPYSWDAPLLSDLGGTINIKQGTTTIDSVTWMASGWDPTGAGGAGCYDLDQDASISGVDRSRWRAGYAMGLQNSNAANAGAAALNNTATNWCEENSIAAQIGGTDLGGTPGATQGANNCQVCL